LPLDFDEWCWTWTVATRSRDASDEFEVDCDNGERERVAFALDCSDREAMSWIATTRGNDAMMVRDKMEPIEWLTDH
jgi:putative transposase